MLQAFLIGIAMGFIFFGGLYFTVQRIATLKHPEFFMLLSLLIRLGILLGGFFVIKDGGIKNLLTAMAGVLVARFILIKKLGNTDSPKKESR